MRFVSRAAGVIGVILFCAASSASAQQSPPLEAAVGYVYMHDDKYSGFWRGWTISFAGKVTPSVAIVGEVGGSYRRNAPEFEVKRSVLVHPLLIGPRFLRPTGPVRPFAQLLAGVTRTSRTSDPSGSGHSWDKTVQPGAGVDIDLSPTNAFRIEVDYRFLQNALGDRREARFVTGFTFRFSR